MNTNDALNYLRATYSNCDFFDSVGVDKYNRYVVYVKYMNENVYTCIKPSLDGKQVLLWFASSKPEVLKAKYGSVKSLGELVRPIVREVKEQDEIFEESDLDDLIFELDRLERLCGSRSLQDVFYEVHDKQNAVTNVSEKYPYVRLCMEKLYETFGFDIIYDELDG